MPHGGSQYSEALKEAIQYASDDGVLFVAAANSSMNNDYFGSYPANYNVSGVISVAASDYNNKLAFFSNFGRKEVHVAAPGHKILSCFGKKKVQIYEWNKYAAPHVSGLAAMLIGLSSPI